MKCRLLRLSQWEVKLFHQNKSAGGHPEHIDTVSRIFIYLGLVFELILNAPIRPRRSDLVDLTLPMTEWAITEKDIERTLRSLWCY
jgi:hypothetical protein